MKNKICVYAICKNEAKFIQRWYDSVKEADYVTVLDTGSSDGSADMLKNLGAIVDTKIISPWRFDVARNESMELIPSDTDICVCCDIDEVFEPGWRQKLENSWTPGTKSARYRYTWNFNEDGSEGIVFYIEKIHSYKNFIWKHPVHEVLEYTGTDPYVSVTAEGVQLNHFADETKPRSQYLPLLELSVQEEPNDDRNMHYLGREYMFNRQWDKSIETLKRHLSLPSATWADERAASMRYIARCYIQKGDLIVAKGMYMKAIAEAPYLREAYIELAQLMYEQKQWEAVIYFCKAALEIAERTKTYICESFAWDFTPFDLLSVAYFYDGQPERSLEYSQKAFQMAPQNERLKNNYEIIKQSINKNSV